MNQSFGNGSMVGQSAAVNTSLSPRLTAEQIAARHVMPRDLPHFSGDPSEWEAFISAYENSTEKKVSFLGGLGEVTFRLAIRSS